MVMKNTTTYHPRHGTGSLSQKKDLCREEWVVLLLAVLSELKRQPCLTQTMLPPPQRRSQDLSNSILC
jgi:hypothetical protein